MSSIILQSVDGAILPQTLPPLPAFAHPSPLLSKPHRKGGKSYQLTPPIVAFHLVPLAMVPVLAAIFLCWVALPVHAKLSKEYPLATYSGLPQTFDETERNSLLSINCARRPDWCVPAVVYQFTAPTSCPGGLEPECPWRYSYQWYDQDYHLLANTSSDPERPFVIPNPWSEIDPETALPDIVFASVRAQADCPCKPVPSGTPSFRDFGTFKIGKEDVVIDVPITVSPRLDFGAGREDPKFNVTFGYRLPPVGLSDTRKRLGWRAIIPPLSATELNKISQIEFIPHGLVQFVTNDDVIPWVMEQIRCFWGDPVPSRASVPVFAHRDEDGESYWSFRVPKPVDGMTGKRDLPFVVDCTAVLDGDDPAMRVDWIVANPISHTHTLSLRFLQFNLKPVDSPVIQFRPVATKNPLRVIDWVVFDEVVQDNSVVPIAPIMKIDKQVQPVISRFQLTLPPNTNPQKDSIGQYVTTFAFGVEFEKFGSNHLDFFRDASPLLDNALTLDLTGVELLGLLNNEPNRGNRVGLDQALELEDSLEPHATPPSVTATYTISCQDQLHYLPVGSGNLTSHIHHEYVNPEYPTLRFTPDVAWKVDSNVTDILCANTTQFLTSFFIVIKTDFIPEAVTDLYHSTMIISTSPESTIGPDTLVASTSYQFTAAARTLITQPFPPPASPVEPFIVNPLFKTIVKKAKGSSSKQDVDDLFDNTDFVNLNTLHLDIVEPYAQPTLTPQFTLDLIGVGYRFCSGSRSNSVDSLVGGSQLSCTFNKDDRGTAIIASPSTLSFSFPTAQWPQGGESLNDRLVKITCPGLMICAVPFVVDESTSGQGAVMIAFTFDSSRPSLVQYLILKADHSQWLFVAGLIVMVLAIVSIVAVVCRIRASRAKRVPFNADPALLDDTEDQYQQLN